MFDAENPTYLLQEVPIPGTTYTMLQEEAAGAERAIEFDVWKNTYLVWNNHFKPPYKAPEIMVTTLDKVETVSIPLLKTCIPVGSIEFVDAVRKRAFGLNPMKPVSVPLWASIESFWKRRIAICSGAEAVQQLYEDWGVEELFIKSATRLKAPFMGIYHKDASADPYKDEGMLLVSSVVRFDSEWRAFVSHGKVLDIKCYSGDPWRLPDKEKLETIAEASRQGLPACTIDVGVMDTGDTVIVEMHKFVSCGLYGAEVPLGMYRIGYKSTLSE